MPMFHLKPSPSKHSANKLLALPREQHVLLAEQAVLEGELRATCYNHSMFVMMKSIVIFAILLLGVATFANYCSLLSAASPSPTPEPTHVATLTPPEPSVS